MLKDLRKWIIIGILLIITIACGNQFIETLSEINIIDILFNDAKAPVAMAIWGILTLVFGTSTYVVYQIWRD